MLKRIKLIVIFIILGILTLSLGCGSKSAEKPTQSAKPAPIGFDHPDMGKVNVKNNIVYKSDKEDELKLDVYYPLGNKDISRAPTVVLVHGIADDNNLKDSRVYKLWGRLIAASGFTAITFNWRPSISSMDVSDLIKYIRRNAKELNINGENICVFAFSAGVQEGVKDALQVNTGFIKSVIVYYGYIDESILTIKTDVKLPSFFIAMGGLDENFPPNTNDYFISKAKESGCNIINMVQPKAGHAFDVFNAADDETKNIIDKTLKFIEDSSNL